MIIGSIGDVVTTACGVFVVMAKMAKPKITASGA